MFMSPGRAGGGLAAVMGNTTPLFALLLAAAFVDERLTRGRLLAVILGTTGVVLIIGLPLGDRSPVATAGALLPLSAASAFAGASVAV